MIAHPIIMFHHRAGIDEYVCPTAPLADDGAGGDLRALAQRRIEAITADACDHGKRVAEGSEAVKQLAPGR